VKYIGSTLNIGISIFVRFLAPYITRRLKKATTDYLVAIQKVCTLYIHRDVTSMNLGGVRGCPATVVAPEKHAGGIAPSMCRQ